MPTDSTARVRINLGPAPYQDIIGPGALSSLGHEMIGAGIARPGARAFLVFDEGVPPADVLTARASLERAGVRVSHTAVRATELNKSLDTLKRVLSEMTGARLERREPVVALGGGIVGDLAGFAAATYRRGVPLVHCPTTLLAMVDSSVGGKTGVNIDTGPEADPAGGLKKNMAGAFHQPSLVVSDTALVRTLPLRQFRTGLAECIKHGMIGAAGNDPGLLAWTEEHLAPALEQHETTLTELIARNVRVKAAVIDGDEREQRPDGGRILLNLGHTFAHAIETLPHLTPDGDPAKAPLLHGEAVALGLIAAAETARELDLCDAACVEQVLSIVSRCGLPVEVNGLPPADRIVALMGFDKKVSNDRLRLVLPTGSGAATVITDPPMAAVLAGLEAIRA